MKCFIQLYIKKSGISYKCILASWHKYNRVTKSSLFWTFVALSVCLRVMLIVFSNVCKSYFTIDTVSSPKSYLNYVLSSPKSFSRLSEISFALSCWEEASCYIRTILTNWKRVPKDTRQIRTSTLMTNSALQKRFPRSCQFFSRLGAANMPPATCTQRYWPMKKRVP